EPILCKRSLQIIIDLLLIDDNPSIITMDSNTNRDGTHVIACNRNLLFKADIDLPRFANKTALANSQSNIKCVCFIGDNPNVDIVRANMYNDLLIEETN
ncbi:unnamed protein product, partial [Rotaria sp. Silwood1]